MAKFKLFWASLFVLAFSLTTFAQDKAFYQKKKIWGKERWILTGNFEKVKKPKMEDFNIKVFHFDPTHQDTTGTCWAFSTISFLESDLYRQHGLKVRLSEMYVVYWEYVEKARRFVQEKGKSFFGQGSESNSAIARIKQYGIVPREIYDGLLPGQERYNHTKMFREMKDYLNFIKEKGYWDEEIVLTTIKQILNKYMGQPPASFRYQGQEYTPITFRDQYCFTPKLNLKRRTIGGIQKIIEIFHLKIFTQRSKKQSKTATQLPSVEMLANQGATAKAILRLWFHGICRKKKLINIPENSVFTTKPLPMTTACTW